MNHGACAGTPECFSVVETEGSGQTVMGEEASEIGRH